MTIDEDKLERRARANIAARNAYKGSILGYVVLAIGLILIWAFTTPGGYFWPIWPIFGMGLAVAYGGLAVYGKAPFHVRQGDVEREMKRLREEGQ